MMPGATAGARAFINVGGGRETLVMQATWTDG